MPRPVAPAPTLSPSPAAVIVVVPLPLLRVPVNVEPGNVRDKLPPPATLIVLIVPVTWSAVPSVRPKLPPGLVSVGLLVPVVKVETLVIALVP